ncbi:unnamed protein product [Cylindrotheca closterium]|uniref:DUF6824 domain-containing protein n=1 Tax=Cylindrotheca closterium TaxID=2856 RepID=A0AAD2GCM9_9STRA|nr:unnamed protein product [Cylindrotheca closterium]
MSVEPSTNKRPLEKDDSGAPSAVTAASSTSTSTTTTAAAVKAEPKVEAKKEIITAVEGKSETVEQPSKKAKLSEEAAEKPAVEGKETPTGKEDEAPKETPKEVKKEPETKGPSEVKEAEGKEGSAPAIAVATSSDPASAEDGQIRPEESEKDAEGRIRKPSNPDILLGRGKPFQNHPGNQRMLRIVDEHKERYLSEKRDKKRAIVEEVLDIIQRHGARFLKRIDHGEYWREVESSVSFEKVSHALRSKVRRPEGFEVNQHPNVSAGQKGPLPILPDGSRPGDANQMASLYNQQFLQQRAGMFPDAAAMGLMANGLMPPFGLMPNMFNPNLMQRLNPQAAGQNGGGGNGGGPSAHHNQHHHNHQGGQQGGGDLEQLVRSQMVDSLLRQRQQLDEALNDVAGGMRLPSNYK